MFAWHLSVLPLIGQNVNQAIPLFPLQVQVQARSKSARLTNPEFSDLDSVMLSTCRTLHFGIVQPREQTSAEAPIPDKWPNLRSFQWVLAISRTARVDRGHGAAIDLGNKVTRLSAPGPFGRYGGHK